MPLHTNANRLITAVHGSKFTPPPGGWNAGSFGREGHDLIVTLTRVAKITQRQTVPEVRAAFLRLLSFQVAEVIRRVKFRIGITSAPEFHGKYLLASSDRKAEVTISIAQHANLWEQAIREVFAEQGDDTVKVMTPPLQSVMAQGYSRTSIMLGTEVDPEASHGIARRAQEMAREIVSINDTTRDQIQRTVDASIQKGDTVADTTGALIQKVNEISPARSLTIARTETMNAWTDGSIQSFKESGTLTHCSVIGCESRERERWNSPSYQQFMYRGESTCNIQDVPTPELDQLNFHPNHTGVLVPSRFVG